MVGMQPTQDGENCIPCYQSEFMPSLLTMFQEVEVGWCYPFLPSSDFTADV